MSSDSRTCSAPDCEQIHYAKGLCNLHWQRARNGPPVMRPREVVAARDELGRKQCGSCLEWLPTTDYAPHKASRDGLQVQCGACRRFAKHGLTPGIAADILARQQGSCVVCSRDLGGGFHIDHDHQCCPGATSCGQCVRGLLCGGCNYKILGHLRDDVAALQRAIEYLKNPPAQQVIGKRIAPIELPNLTLNGG